MRRSVEIYTILIMGKKMSVNPIFTCRLSKWISSSRLCICRWWLSTEWICWTCTKSIWWIRRRECRCLSEWISRLWWSRWSPRISSRCSSSISNWCRVTPCWCWCWRLRWWLRRRSTPWISWSTKWICGRCWSTTTAAATPWIEIISLGLLNGFWC